MSLVLNGCDRSGAASVAAGSAPTEASGDESGEAASVVEPRIAVRPAVLDLGVVSAGEEARGAFWISNEGELSATVRRVQTSCGCTIVDSSRRELGPGQVIEAPVRLRVSGRPGREIVKRAQFIVADLDEPVVCEVRAEVEGGAGALPAWEASPVEHGEPAAALHVTPRRIALGEIAGAATFTVIVDDAADSIEISSLSSGLLVQALASDTRAGRTTLTLQVVVIDPELIRLHHHIRISSGERTCEFLLMGVVAARIDESPDPFANSVN